MNDNTDVHSMKPKDPALQNPYTLSTMLAAALPKAALHWELCAGGINDTAYKKAK